MIAAAGVEKQRGGLTVRLDGLTVPAGRRLAITGPSGCGKSTALDLMAGTLRPDRADRLTVAGRDLTAGGDYTGWRARAIGIVLQTGGLIPSLTVAENIRLSRRLLGLNGWGPGRDLAQALGVGSLLDRYPAQISIGERQRVAIARALAHEPPLVLADEPTAALDPDRAAAVLTLLVQLAARAGTTLVIVTHDLALAADAGLDLLPCRVEAGITLLTGGDE